MYVCLYPYKVYVFIYRVCIHQFDTRSQVVVAVSTQLVASLLLLLLLLEESVHFLASIMISSPDCKL